MTGTAHFVAIGCSIDKQGLSRHMKLSWTVHRLKLMRFVVWKPENDFISAFKRKLLYYPVSLAQLSYEFI